LANEEASGHDFPTYRHDRGPVLGLSRSKPARPDGGGASECGLSLGSDGDAGLSGGGSSSRLSLARVAESAKHLPQCPSPDRTVFIGLFYNQFLPGGTGGDIIKSYYLLKETPDKKAGALLAVVFDRFIGLVALVAVTATLIALRYDFLAQKPETRNLLWLLLILLSASVAFLIATFVISGFKLFRFFPAHFPGRDKLIEIFAAYHLYAHHWRASLVAFGASIVAHLATFSAFLFAAYALGVHVPLVDFLPSCRLNERSRLYRLVSLESGSAKSFADHAQRALRCSGSKSHPHRVAEFRYYSRLLSSGRFCLPVLQAEWRSRTRETPRDGKGSCHAGT